MPTRLRRLGAGVALLLLAAMLPQPLSTPAAAAPPASVLPPGLEDTTVLTGLYTPTALRFAPDGRIFVAEKTGVIRVFSGLDDRAPRTVVDLTASVDDYGDRGLLGLALSPDFSADPALYVLYTFDAPAGGSAPRWNDDCPTPPGPTTDGCVVTARLSRLPLSGDRATGERVLLSGWCQQFPSHSIGDLAFDRTGALIVSGGDGASYTGVDYGQNGGTYAGDKANPCGDPPGGVGSALVPPGAQGGALRAQSLGRPAGPTVLNGSLLRLDPLTGRAAPGNPAAGSKDANQARIVATGMRNPYRFAVRPGTGEVWVADVGWNAFEEIDRVRSTTDAVVENFGWPCYEGGGAQPGYRAAGLAACQRLYARPGAVAAPFYSYAHGKPVVGGDGCSAGGSSISGITFNNGRLYPPEYDGALIFSDYSRNCIWVMRLGADGNPDPKQVSVVESDAAGPVDLQTGPDGLLYYVGILDGSIHRIEPGVPPAGDIYLSSLAWTSMSNGKGPVERDTSVGGPEIADGGPITVDGRAYPRGLGTHAPSEVRYDVPAGCDTFLATAGIDDAQAPRGSAVFQVRVDGVPAFTSGVVTSTSTPAAVRVPVSGARELALLVTDGGDGSAFDDADWADAKLACNGGPPGNQPPVVTISAPTDGLGWQVGQRIPFAGSARDPESGPVPAAALTWRLDQHHCPASCHVHVIQQWHGVTSGSFTTADIDYPGWYELVLTARDRQGAVGTSSVRLNPRTVRLTFQSRPAGLVLAVGSVSGTTPFTRTVILGSASTVSAMSPQKLGARSYAFSSWSDGGARSHSVVAPGSPTTYTANFH